jgi:hypothetical protein
VEESQAKVPTIVSTGIICLLIGVFLGVLGMSLFGGSSNPLTAAPADAAAGGGPSGMPGMSGSGSGGGMGGMSMSKGGMGKKGGGPNPKNQLVALVTKLDQLSQKPLAVQFTADQKKKVQEQLAGLDSKDDLDEADAKKRLDTLLDVVKDQKETLEAAGYRWPGQGGMQPPPATPPNPFKDDKNAKGLKSLQALLAAPSAK